MTRALFLQLVLVGAACSAVLVGWVGVVLAALISALMGLDAHHAHHAERNLSEGRAAELTRKAEELIAQQNKAIEEIREQIREQALKFTHLSNRIGSRP